MYLTFADLLSALREQHGQVLQRFVTPQGIVERTGAQLFEAAQHRGSQLTALGLCAGARVALLVTDPLEFLPLLQGCLLYGLVPVPFYPPPLFGKFENYHAALGAVLSTADVQVAIADDGSAQRHGSVFTSSSLIELTNLPASPISSPPPVNALDLALLQFTSGSTQAPRGVRVTHQALLANAVSIMHDGLAATSADHGVCWLPLYHDMGLVGFGLAPLLTQTPVTFLATSRFIRNPKLWLQTLHDVRGTITFAPNFAYALTTKRCSAEGLDLSCVRMWGCGAEPISERSLQAFEAHFAASGVAPGSIAPCYGLAEATLAVTFTPPRSVRTTETIDRDAWAQLGTAVAITPSAVRDEKTRDSTAAGTPTYAAIDAGSVDTAAIEAASKEPRPNELTVVSCGRPLPGYVVSIVSSTGHLLSDRQVGEIVVQGPSLGDGYHGQPKATALTFRESGLHTGDRGYLSDGQLFVVGRIKDTLMLNGRKYDPHVLEDVLETLPMVRRAAAVNITANDGEVLAVVVERTLEPGTADASTKELIRTTLAAHFGVQTTFITCVAPGSLPRTTSGKLQRAKAKALVERA
jgi:fatty-acyl-CoA synthase